MAGRLPVLDRAVAVGRVSPRGVRLWMRSPGGGAHRLELWPEQHPEARIEHAFEIRDRAEADHTFVIAFPEELPPARPLAPLTAYRFRISRADGEIVGEGRFETSPAVAAEMPSRFCLGVASCHQPFDEHGQMHPAGVRMLGVARTVWERYDVKHVLWLGDQLYADYPHNQSLFEEEYFREVAPPGRRSLLECTREEALRVYHARYRRGWGHPAWLELLARFPGYPILDDHEVVDNFGSLPEHHTEAWRHIRQAAGAAYRHYQHLRVEPSPADHDGPYDYRFEYGAAAGYMLDVRSMRLSTDGEHARVFAPHQLDHFAAWLNVHAEAPVLFVGISVPPFFIPGLLARVLRWTPGSFREDAHDRWMHPQYRADRRKLLTLIREHQGRHPRQKVVLVCGDVHVGFVARCDWRTDPATSLYQFTSSSITHVLPSMDWQIARHVPRTHFALFDTGDSWARIHLLGGSLARVLEQPVGALNVGVIEVDVSGEVARLNFRLYGEDPERPGEPRCLFESGFE